MHKLKQKLKLLQKMLSQIQNINKEIVFKLVKQFEKDLNLTTILKTIQIKRSTYYYWLKTKAKLKLKQEKYLLQQKRIASLCKMHEYFLGHRKITVLYQKIFNEIITKKKVYLMMKEKGICCRLRIKKNKYHYHSLQENLNIVPNLIKQDFKTTQPMQKLFTDITYFKTNEGFLYFSCIIDAFNNQIIASHISNRQNKDLILNTIKKIPKLKKPCIIHSDQGTVYQSPKIQQTLTKKGFLISMSRKATPRDNALIENLFGQMKSILFYRDPFLFQKSPAKIKNIINQFPSFWNKKWLLTKLNYLSPIQYAQSLR
ncbi:IS3 family transposase ['Fragaria x ananassa' phyllody phytoplasma]|uniref:IS3 family transposase n=1 Tax='Fragaria x ananassa' phyllody phytoplasma TaxID=2358428 RepID=A0ABS5K3E1_9MOLU|nr:IS3 family transposase ['Fragaria x ananassa' phyllody phytoplasma]MBS2126422.1 IS3 family transposase ['Fragaria x ananassa' phyllody phytoplasma]